MKQYRLDTDLQCFTLRVVAYQAECTCGFAGRYFRSRSGAATERSKHLSGAIKP